MQNKNVTQMFCVLFYTKPRPKQWQTLHVQTKHLKNILDFCFTHKHGLILHQSEAALVYHDSNKSKRLSIALMVTQSVNCYVGSHNVTCHLTVRQISTRFTYP